ncbi:MAG: hypothetical protein AAF702_07465 [Chloroflexota bacterium]
MEDPAHANVDTLYQRAQEPNPLFAFVTDAEESKNGAANRQ